MPKDKVPENTIKRLPIYLRILENLETEGQKSINSKDFEGRTQINPAMLRKDLSYFGKLGVRGQGYQVSKLKDKIKSLLGIYDQSWEAVILGAGNIARALIKYPDFREVNLKIMAAFDNDPKKIGKKIGGGKVYAIHDFERYIKEKKPQFIVLTTPGEAIDEIVAKIRSLKIKGIINFTPKTLNLGKRIRVININITAEFLTLFYYLKKS